MRFLTKQWALLFGSVAFLTPAVAFAQQLTGLTNLVVSVANIVNILIPLLMAMALVAFFYGLVRALFSGSDEVKKQGYELMKWGIIILFVMVAVWGIIQFIAGNLGIATGGSVTPPTVSQN